ncbi:hypothetical protein QQZ08_004443 [Neonectria magnoliae]|uniref:Uncharacterized protein n=1 Tax=Neonectria magnoliae TaxID=2732573 RepID=A0ABR1I6R9_9HYPO
MDVPRGDGPICTDRTLDWIARNILLSLNIPLLQYPGNPDNDVGAHWRDMQAKARTAVLEWHLDLEVLLHHEEYPAYLEVACVVLLIQHLRLVVDDIDGDGAQRHRLFFYGFAADELTLLLPVRGLRLPHIVADEW